MFRERKGLSRKSSGQYQEPNTVFVIASEGTETEPRYFEYLKKHTSKLIKVEVLTRKLKGDTSTDPMHIIELLNEYKKEYALQEGDELWLLIDRDHRKEGVELAKLSEIAQECRQKEYEFCLTTPCIELWFLLHLVEWITLSEVERQAFFDNKKVNKNRTALEKALSEAIGYQKNTLNMNALFPLTSNAIKQAFDLELEKNWQTDKICTKIHVLVNKLLN